MLYKKVREIGYRIDCYTISDTISKIGIVKNSRTIDRIKNNKIHNDYINFVHKYLHIDKEIMMKAIHIGLKKVNEQSRKNSCYFYLVNVMDEVEHYLYKRYNQDFYRKYIGIKKFSLKQQWFGKSEHVMFKYRVKIAFMQLYIKKYGVKRFLQTID